jgi:putative membrane protein
MSGSTKIAPHRFTVIISTASLFLSSWLVANVDIGESVTWVSAFFILILAIPSYYYWLKWLPLRTGTLILLFLGIFPIMIESIGIATGFPYGGFHYTDEMGFKIFGLVPWSVAFAFGPLVIGSFTLASSATRNPKTALLLGALLLVTFDLILDPAAVVLSIWVWDNPGPYYGIPITNYIGWLLTGYIVCILLHALTANDLKELTRFPRELSLSLLLTVAFWTGYSLWVQLLIPVLIGIGMIAVLLFFLLIEK